MTLLAPPCTTPDCRVYTTMGVCPDCRAGRTDQIGRRSDGNGVVNRVCPERCEHCGTALGEISYSEQVGAWICMGCFFRLPVEETELGTRSGNKELGTRTTSTPLRENLVPSSSELGSATTPSSPVDSVTLIVEDVRQLRAERIANPPKVGDPNVVPYSLGFAVKRGKAKDKNEAKRAIDEAVQTGELKFEYALEPRGQFTKHGGTRCYSLGVTP